MLMKTPLKPQNFSKEIKCLLLSSTERARDEWQTHFSCFNGTSPADIYCFARDDEVLHNNRFAEKPFLLGSGESAPKVNKP